MHRLIFAALFCLISDLAFAQSSPGLFFGQVPTLGEWNSCLAAKQDHRGAAPCITTRATLCILTGETRTVARTTISARL